MQILKKPLVFVSLIASLFFLGALVIAIFSFKNLPDEIIIRFNDIDGVKGFTGKIDIFGILAISLFSLVANSVLAEQLYFRERILSFILMFSNIFISIWTLVIISVINSIN